MSRKMNFIVAIAIGNLKEQKAGLEIEPNGVVGDAGAVVEATGGTATRR